VNDVTLIVKVNRLEGLTGGILEDIEQIAMRAIKAGGAFAVWI
jgi:hypothetical protein